MAKKLKDYYDFNYIDDLAKRFSKVDLNFDEKLYKKEIPDNYDELTFLKRQDVIANAIQAGLSGKYTENLDTFRLMWGEELKKDTGMFTEGWWLWPIGRYIEHNALKDIDATLSFAYDFTKRHTSEFIVRPILINNTSLAMKTFLKWSQDENVHVRRLATEGMRIALPWSVKTKVALNEPLLYEQILDNLKEDSSKFVQKSVGNNLNDLYKIDPEFANTIINKWMKTNPSEETLWIIKHGKRSQIKKTDKNK